MIIVDFDKRDQSFICLFSQELATGFDGHKTILFAVNDRRQARDLRIGWMILCDVVEKLVVKLSTIVRVGAR